PAVCWVTLVLVLAVCLRAASGGCSERLHPRCCPGRDSECRGSGSCYCDTYCRYTGDCCPDYRHVCHISAIDCVVGAWVPWTACSSPCGVGSRERERLVTIPPRNGGAPCPDVKQRRGCYGHHPDQCHSVKEVAKILPDTFKRNFKDPWKRPHMMAKEQRPSYCAYFRMKELSAWCRWEVWTSHLFREKNVCVECQGEAMGNRGRCEGDGRQGTRTFWISAHHPRCHGSWVLESMRRNCNCSPKSLIFV
ncbi:somatomedin-B and thrombospondin type-1 domain-containing protein, partial [Leucoraja erinacea]|uniref:somatomedin-B and thrombospondin type-1 domain-containing protein n=1 Tax=Leucoraja erinaceus TaxID=7782 RepID=UPI0024573194